MGTLIAFILFLGPLVFFHELGHYLFAKLFNVKVETFSIGFGPKLLKKRWGETEYAISAIPLGGYVKIFGEDRTAELTEEEKKRALAHQSKSRRFWIIFGGPLFNILFTFALMFFILGIGEPKVTSHLGRVTEQSQAWQAGLRVGDRVVSVNNQPIRFYEELIQIISEKPNERVQLGVERGGYGEPTQLAVTLGAAPGYNLYGQTVTKGELEGILPAGLAPVVAVTDPESIAGRAGVQTGDRIEAVVWDGDRVTFDTWEGYEEFFRQSFGEHQFIPEEFSIEFQKADSGEIVEKTFEGSEQIRDLGAIHTQSFNPLSQFLGMHSTELLIAEVMEGEPAELAGLQAGDRVVTVYGRHPRSFDHLRTMIQEFAQQRGSIFMIAERQGELIQLQIEPHEGTERDLLGRESQTFSIGVRSSMEMSAPQTEIYSIRNPITLVGTAASETWRMIELTAVTFKKLIFGEVSPRNVGGPILIGKVASDSLDVGWVYFFKLMALISINLAILNLLPIPVLDGGHLLFLGIEAITGKPLSLKKMEIAQQVGLTLLLALMVFAFYNDLSRFIDFRQIFQ